MHVRHGRESATRPVTRYRWVAAMAAVLAAATAVPAEAALAGPVSAARPERLSVREAFDIGYQAYEYGYPLVLYGQTQLVATNVATAGTKRAPVNQFMYGTLAGPDETDVVLPNVNVIYNNAFLDLQPEPMVLAIPDTQGRFWIQEILDAWTNVQYDPGTRTAFQPGDYLLAGPDWDGTVPAGIDPTVLRMPTNLAWIAGRNFTTGDPADLATATAIQKGFTLMPLSAYPGPYTPPPNTVDPDIDMADTPVAQVAAMSAQTFFAELAMWCMTNPPQSVDGPILEQLAEVGLVPGEPYDLSAQPRAVQNGMTQAATAAYRYLSSDAAVLQVHQPVNGWTSTIGFDGQWDTRYPNRAVTAYRGIGANAEQDAVYVYANRDRRGRLLDASTPYEISFPADGLPLVALPSGEQGFWSVTVYQEDGILGPQVPNVIGSTQVGAGTWTPGPDGQYRVRIQQEQPQETGIGWVKPPPSGEFVLLIRMYNPLPVVYEDPSNPYVPPVIRNLTGPDRTHPRLSNAAFWPQANGRYAVPR